jgi:dienelactone hydrolase
MVKREITENGIVADLFHDGSGQPRKAIVMLGGSEGGKTFSGFILTRRRKYLVSLGYTLFSLAYFKSPGLPETLEAIPLEYFERAFAWLSKQKEVVPDELALLGASRGGEVALILGAMDPKVKAVIALSPSSVVWQGIPQRGTKMGGSAKSDWTYQGKELPISHITHL